MSISTGNLSALARRPGMPSIWTLRRLVASCPEFPIVARGTRGRGYVIDLDAAERFVLAVRSHQIIDPARRRAAIRALGLEMLALEVGQSPAVEA